MGRKEKEQSIYILSEKTQDEMGVYSVHIDKNLFQTSENLYVKVYRLKEILKSPERKKQFQELLNMITHNRIRISWFCSNNNAKFTIYLFMSVFYEADSFEAAVSKSEEFETLFSQRITNAMGITLENGKWINILSYICMNANGKMRELKAKDFLGKRANWHELLVSNEQRNYECYIARNFPNKEIDLSELLEMCNGKLHIALDFEFLTDEENRLLDLEISNKYNIKMDLPQKRVVNMSFIMMILTENKDELEKMKMLIEDFFYKNEVLLYSSSKTKTCIADSINSLGLYDFQSMENVEPSLFRSLLL